MLRVDGRPRMRRRLLIVAAALIAAPLTAAPPARATCRCGSGTTELCIVLDATGSMDAVMGTAKEQLYRLVAALEGTCETLRVGAVVYQSLQARDYVTKKIDLSSDRKALVEWIKSVHSGWGGEEAVGEALDGAVNGMSWSKGARKVIVLVGDEGPGEKPADRPEKEARCLALARLAKSRGIAVNVVTWSFSAWQYWAGTHSDEWERRKRELGETRAKEEFQLPFFQQLAEAGGGLSVSSKDTKELLKWLLVIASGARDVSRDDVKKFLEWDPAAGAKPAGRSPMMAQLRHSGEWTTARNFEALRAALGQKVRLDFDSAVEVVPAEDRALAGRPLVYLTGHGKIELDAVERGALKRHLEGGGLLWADACCGREEFDAALRKLVAELFPEAKLAPLAAADPLYNAGYAIEKVRYAEKPRTADTGFAGGPPRLEGLRLGKRLAVVYSRDSLGCGWAAYPLGRPCQMADEDALKLSINILLYALTAEQVD